MERRRQRKKKRRPSLATLRVCELNRLFYTRYRGTLLPDDDDGRDSVEIIVNHLVMLFDPRLRAGDWICRCVPWLGKDASERLIARAIARQIKWRADSLARRLNLTSSERDRLKIRTIGAVDLNKEQREERQRQRDRLAKEAKRRAAGAKPQAQSASRTKPWVVLGIGRSRWYDNRRTAREGEVLKSGQFRRRYEANVTSDEFVQTCLNDLRSDATSIYPLLEICAKMPSRAATMSDRCSTQ